MAGAKGVQHKNISQRGQCLGELGLVLGLLLVEADVELGQGVDAALLDLLGDCSTQIDSLDEPIVGLTYFVLQDYATGEGVSSNTVYFRMTQEQFDRFLALTAPYADA